MINFKTTIAGHLDIFVSQQQDELDDVEETWHEVLIHGDPQGLRSLADLLLQLADADQDSIPDLPVGAREHVHLRPDVELSNSSVPVIIGRLDAKGTGAFYSTYTPRNVPS